MIFQFPLQRTEEDPGYIIIPERETLKGKNGYKWTSESKRTGKTPTMNIVHVRPCPASDARNILDPVRIFQIFFSRHNAK